MISEPEVDAQKHLIVILGPTAVGKTAVAIQIAKELNTEIISADSRQFYKEMKIGTAVPSQDELSMVKHHFIGNLSVNEKYDVSKFETDVLYLLNKLFQLKKTVILAGGSGLYIDAICKGIDLMPDAEPELREHLNQAYTNHGIIPLREQLKLLDPVSYHSMDIANPKRIIRALEVCISTGQSYSSLLHKKVNQRSFNIIPVGLKRDKAELYKLINKRVDDMMSRGLEQEARQLIQYKGLTALNAVGYRELFNYFEGKCSLDEAVDKIKVNTRRYAKKQMTWFSRDEGIMWFHPDQIKEISNFIRTSMKLKTNSR